MHRFTRTENRAVSAAYLTICVVASVWLGSAGASGQQTVGNAPNLEGSQVTGLRSFQTSIPSVLNPSFASSSAGAFYSSAGYTATGSSLGTLTLGFAPEPAAVLTVVSNTGTSGIVGTLTGLAEGATVTAGFGGNTFHFRISYVGGDGNDVTLTRIGSAGQQEIVNSTTLAGTAGTSGTADGAGGAARFNNPQGVAVDASGNVYVADTSNSTIRKITSAGVVTTLAGTAGTWGSADGTGGAARFNNPQRLAVDSAGNVYVADYLNHAIRKLSASGVVTTLAGMAGASGSADGTGSAARFNLPTGVAVDGVGNVYVADLGNHTIRKITSAGVVTTLAGTAGAWGSADGAGSAATFYGPQDVAVDSAGNVYVADSFNHTIRKVSAAGAVTTLAGTAGARGSADGAGSAATFYGPQGMAVDGAGNVYVADSFNHTIRKVTSAGVVTTLAGMAGTSGSVDGTGSAAKFRTPGDVAVSSAGNVYVADGNFTIRKLEGAGFRPILTLAAATAVGEASATLNGSVNPNGFVTTARFEYGTATSYGSTANITLSPDNGTAAQNVSAALTGLSPGTSYYYRLAATNVDGTQTTSDGSFQTPTPSVLNPGFASSSSGGAYSFSGYTATGSSLGTLTLGFAPQPAAVLTVVNNTGTSGIVGTLTGLAEGAAVTASFGGNTFHFRISYVGGDGNDITLKRIGGVGQVANGNSDTWSTLAGTAGSFGSADGTGNTVRFKYPSGVAVDSAGNVYVADPANHTIRKVTSAGVVTTLAGTAGTRGSADGTGSTARFDYPTGVAVDSAGNVYVSDTGNHTIRKLTSVGVVTTLAGTAGTSGSTDGTGSAARFTSPQGVAVDGAGNVYVADRNNHTVRKISAAGVVTTLAGTAGLFGSADGTGSAARFTSPQGVAVDSAGNVYVAGTGNHTIRKITSSGLVTTLAGTAGSLGSADGTGSAARFKDPYGVAVDGAGNVYVADKSNHTIRKITSAGVVTTLGGTAGTSGSADGTAGAARFRNPEGVAVDNAGNVYVADRDNHTIRKLEGGAFPPILALAAATAVGEASATLNGSVNPNGFVTTARFEYGTTLSYGSTANVALSPDNGTAAQNVSAVLTALSSDTTYYYRLSATNVDGTQTTSSGSFRTPIFLSPSFASSSAGAFYSSAGYTATGTSLGTLTLGFAPQPEAVLTVVNNTGTSAIEGTLIGLAEGATVTAGFGGNTFHFRISYVGGDGNDITLTRIGGAGQVDNSNIYAWSPWVGSRTGPGALDGTGRAARFSYPLGAAVDSAGNVYVADTRNHTIRKMTSSGVVTTLAGKAGTWGSANGTGSAARFNFPTGVAVDGAGNVYVADGSNHTIRKITSAGVVTTLAGSAGTTGSANGTGSAARFNFPTGVAVDGAGNVYVADGSNHTIRKITSAGVVTTMAGTAGTSGSADGTGSAARFNNPRGVAVDGAGNVYVGDISNHTIRKITSAGVVTTLAGTAGTSGSTDGAGSAARFNFPTGVAVDGAGNVYVADTSNHGIRKVSAAGVVTKLAGASGLYGATDGTGSAAIFNSPQGVAVDSTGNVYVADTENHTIRNVTAAGVVTTSAGMAGAWGSADGAGSAARFDTPDGAAVDASGNVYVADTENHTIRRVSAAGIVTTFAGTAGSFGSVNGTGSAARFIFPSGAAVDASGNVYVADTSNHTIRKITSAGVVTTLAGTAGASGSTDGTGSAARFSFPSGVAVDASGNVYVADTSNHTIRKVTSAGVVATLAGTAGEGGSTDGTGSAARFNSPRSVAVDTSGNVYVADTSNHTIRKITSAGVVTTLAGSAGLFASTDGTGSAARFNLPTGVALDSAGNVFVADYGNHTIRQVTSAGVVTTVGGGAWWPGSSAGYGTASGFNFPLGIAVGAEGALYVTDKNHRVVRGRLAGFRPLVTQGSVTGLGATSATLNGTVNPNGFVTTARFDYGTTTSYGSTANVTLSPDNGTAAQNVSAVLTGLAPGTTYFYRLSATNVDGTQATTGGTFQTPTPPVLNPSFTSSSAGSAYNFTGYTATGSSLGTLTLGFAAEPAAVLTVVNNTGTSAIEGTLTGLAEGATVTGSFGGNTFHFRISYVGGDGNNITLTRVGGAGQVSAGNAYWWTTLAGTAGTIGSTDGIGSAARFNAPAGVAVDASGNVYVADNSNHTIRKVTSAGVVTTLAGTAGTSGSADATGSAARFNSPRGVAADAAGNVYVADEYNHTIRKVTPAGVVTTLVGAAGTSGSTDGTGSAARFRFPAGVAVDASGNVYVADSSNHTIRRITSAGVVTTLAGTAGASGSTDGTGSAARFNYPPGVAVDTSGNVYVADRVNETIRKVSAMGAVSTLAGTAGVWGSADGTGSAARFDYPTGAAVDAAGNVYVADEYNHTIRKITSARVVATLAGTAGTSGSADGTGSAAGFYLPRGVAVDTSGNVYVADTSNHTIRQGVPGAVFQPVLTVGAASALGQATATLNGTVNPNGFVTTARFEYGTTTNYGSAANVTLSPDNGTTAQNVSAVLTGLSPSTTYYYRLVATNVDGTQSIVGGSFSTTAAATGFSAWSVAPLLPENRRGLMDRNGPMNLPNFLSYAMAIDPRAATPADMPALGQRGTGTMKFIFRRAKNLPDADLRIMSSTNLSTPWTAADVHSTAVLQDGGDHEKVEATIGIPMGAATFFLRLHAEQK